MANTLGSKIKVTVFGQSHAPAIGVVIDGLPAGMRLDREFIQSFMARRAPGRSDLSTARREADIPRVLSGLNEREETCGAPLCAIIENTDTRSADYASLRDHPRPGHADYTAALKFDGANDIRGGGQFSGRLTAPLCFAGAVCLQWLKECGVRVGSRIVSIGNVEDAPLDHADISDKTIRMLTEKAFPVFDDTAGDNMRNAIRAAGAEGDSIGGIIEVFAIGLPAGLGEPMFDGIENRMAAALFGIPAIRGVEFGAGFAATKMKGSEHNDNYLPSSDKRILTETNRHGGVLGGITTGMPLVARVAVKPTPSIAKEQQTVSISENNAYTLSVKGRHDPCIVPRAIPCVEAVTAIVLMNFMM